MKDDVNRVFVAANGGASLRSHGRAVGPQPAAVSTGYGGVHARSLKWLRVCKKGRTRQDSISTSCKGVL